ncbi:hypothetical protein EVG20_g2243, partial [Dentipellis fragilis]
MSFQGFRKKQCQDLRTAGLRLQTPQVSNLRAQYQLLYFTDDITIETEDTPLEVCGWNGRVDWEYEGVEEDWMDADSNAADEDCTEMVEFEMSELEGDELIENLRRGMLSEEQEFTRPDAEVENNEPTLYKRLAAQKVTPSQWSTAERKRALGYNGLSGRTKRREKKNAKDKAEQDARMRETKSAKQFTSFFTSAPSRCNVPAAQRSDLDETHGPEHKAFSGYLSDTSDNEGDYLSDAEADNWFEEDLEDVPARILPQHPLAAAPPYSPPSDTIPSASRTLKRPLAPHTPSPEPEPAPSVADPTGMRKRRKLDVPVLVARQKKQADAAEKRRKALVDIQKVLASRREVFVSGKNGLQSYRARAIQACLSMMTKNGRGMMEASRIAAEANGFSRNWGSRLVRRWTQRWIKDRTLPESLRGNNAKVFSILCDPTVRAKMRAYLRSNKWAVDPAKAAKFAKQQMVPEAAREFAQSAVQEEMPRGLKKYLEDEILPEFQLKPGGKGFSLSTMRRLMLDEGFSFTEHKKALYYDGHERPDVVHDRQKRFLPELLSHRHRIVRYVVGDVEHELDERLPKWNCVEPRLVVCAHDESTMQANDGMKRSWVLDGEQPLRKKGQGRGIHRSDVICSTVGWLKDAGQSLEYGKNYEGYWTGELFVNQVTFDQVIFRTSSDFEFLCASQLKTKIIPAFEDAHGPGYQALFLIDNSQGHAAYAEDSLRATRMNLKPGGKQARMRDGWYHAHGADDQCIIQPMNFPPQHKEHPNEPKGMRQVLKERGLWRKGLLMQCKEKCHAECTDCCARRILESQPDFKEQKSLVQEVIEAAGHLCIFLPKFHCELNFIEYYWGASKKWLRDHCDYTFETLKENVPKALESVSVATIRRWEHRTWRFVDAYGEGLDAKDCQKK